MDLWALPGRARLSVLDLAPLLACLAGAPIPDELEGALPTALLEPSHLEAHPPRRVTEAELPGLPELGAGGADESECALLERLRSMGYVR